MRPVLLVSGPTASGKSDLAVRLASSCDGEVVNIDSVQIFKELDIGSAKTSTEQMQGVPHHLIGLKRPDEVINAAEYTRLAEVACADIQARERLPVLVGGTGMYVTFFFHGMADLPARDFGIRQELEELDSKELFSRLLKEDPATAARLHENDRVRVIRALEIVSLGATSEKAFQEHGFKEIKHPGLAIILCWRRDELYARIEERAGLMLKEGLIEETVRAKDVYGEHCQPFKALGYLQVLKYLKGDLDFEELHKEISRQTRRFAKRQMTYWRNDPVKRGWLPRPGLGEDSVVLPVKVDEGMSKRNMREQKSFRVFSYDFETLTQRVKERLSEPFERNEVWYVDAEKLGRADD